VTRFKRLTVDEAAQMTRLELLCRLETESAYWDRKLRHGTENDWADYKLYQICLHMIDPAQGIGDTLA